MQRRILHLDIDAFLASIEQLVEPSLRHRPVAVGSGVVASRSYEAKARGVQTAMPMAEARRVCPELVVRAGDAGLAERFRQAVAEVLRSFSPRVQICSLDDMYADLSGVPLPNGCSKGKGKGKEESGCVTLARNLRAQVQAVTGLSVSLGIGASKTVARMATSHAKPAGILEIPAGEELTFLGPHALRDLPGIGAKTAALLHDLGLHKVADLWSVDAELLRRSFGLRGLEMHRRAQGLDTDEILDSPPQQSISRETSFAPVAERDFLLGMLFYLLDRASTELRAQGLQARRLEVRVQHVDRQRRQVSGSLPQAVDGTDALFAVAQKLMQGLWERRVLVRLVGVSLLSLQRRRAWQCSGERQGELFADAAAVSATAVRAPGQLYAAVDGIRQRHGFGKLVLGPAVDLLGQVENGQHGFRLRTPSLTR